MAFAASCNVFTAFPALILPLSLYEMFYICRSVHRNSMLKKSNKMQLHADIYLLLNYSTCFGRQSRPSSGVHKTTVAASGTDHAIWEASFLKRNQIRTGVGDGPKSVLIWSCLRKLATQIVWSVPEAATTVYVLLMMGAMDARNT